jgi:hypothetical protein
MRTAHRQVDRVASDTWMDGHLVRSIDHDQALVPRSSKEEERRERAEEHDSYVLYDFSRLPKSFLLTFSMMFARMRRCVFSPTCWFDITVCCPLYLRLDGFVTFDSIDGHLSISCLLSYSSMSDICICTKLFGLQLTHIHGRYNNMSKKIAHINTTHQKLNHPRLSSPILLPRQKEVPNTRMPPRMLLRPQVHSIALLPPLQRPLDSQPRLRMPILGPAITANPSLQQRRRHQVCVGDDPRADAAMRVVAVDLVLWDLF